jgi:hypothetical protein
MKTFHSKINEDNMIHEIGKWSGNVQSSAQKSSGM